MQNLTVILVRTKFSENIGSTARVCANFGCPNLRLVQPLDFSLPRAAVLATPKGKKILENIQIFSSLSEALVDLTGAFATTARIGGFRKGLLLPDQAGAQIAELLFQAAPVGLVFGSEDKGLTNEEIQICGQIITIPTTSEAWSLNLSHAVNILLYECFKQKRAYTKTGDFFAKTPKLATVQEMELLFAHLKDALLKLDFLHADNNPDYFMMPVKRFFNRVKLRKHEYNLFMGICRQIRWLARKNKK